MEKAAAPTYHVVAVPYPGRGHINPVMNLCKLLATREPSMLLTFVVPLEWLPALESEPKPDNVALASMPDVLPSQDARKADPQAFYEAVSTLLEAPFETVLDQLHPVTAILADVSLVWPTGVGNRRGIPVASLFTMSAMMFSLCHNFHLFEANGHYPADFLERGDEVVEYIPGVSSTRLQDLPTFMSGGFPRIVSRLLESFSWLPKAQYQLISTIYELEPHTIDILRSDSFPNLYTVGPAIRYHELPLPSTPSPARDGRTTDHYLQWLDAKPGDSVLYMSLGTYVAVSREQTEHLAAGLRESGVQFLWEACGGTTDLEAMICPGSGLVVPWCDQLRVLNHPAVGGFLSYCSWNYVEESVFSGVPVLTFPTGGEQPSNSKLIVDDWKIGLRMKKDMHPGALVDKEEVAKMVKRLMDLESAEGKEMRARAREIRESCRSAVLEGGSSESNIKAFLSAISPAS